MNGVGLSLVCYCVLLGFPVQAAQAFQTPSSSQEQGGQKWPTPDEVVSRLATRLSLSGDQQAQIKPLIAGRQAKLKALATDTSLHRISKARKMKKIFDESDEKIKAVLNDDQKKQYSQIEKVIRDQARQRVH